MKDITYISLTLAALLAGCATTNDVPHELDNDKVSSKSSVPVTDSVIAQQRKILADKTAGKGFGPQSPRDIDSHKGMNKRVFGQAPSYNEMNLCNIHFHKNAEHKGGDFTKYAGNGDGLGYHSGYQYAGSLVKSQEKPIAKPVCPSKHGGLSTGDTIEVHYVHSSAEVKPGPTLGACVSEAIKNPQLLVETQVYVLVNDESALDFKKLTQFDMHNGYYQALNIPNNTGKAVEYIGSTTGPGYNEKASPYKVSWSVRPKVAMVDINSVGEWCKGNVFNEDHAHGVRNLVMNPALLSEIK